MPMRTEPPRAEDIAAGRRIHALRTAAGLSQTQLAKRIGTSFQQVQKYEKGDNRISVSRLFDLGRALGVAPTAILEGIDADSGNTKGPELLILTPRERRAILALRGYPPEIQDGFHGLVASLGKVR